MLLCHHSVPEQHTVRGLWDLFFLLLLNLERFAYKMNKLIWSSIKNTKSLKINFLWCFQILFKYPV